MPHTRRASALLVGLVELLAGSEAGRGIVILLECIFLVVVIAAAAQTESGHVLWAAIVPVTVILCLADNATRRMIEDAGLGWISPSR